MAQTQTQTTIIFYPSPLIGHIVPMVELAKLILKHHPSFSIIFIITTPPPLPPLLAITKAVLSYIQNLSSITPSITFHHLKSFDFDEQTFSFTCFEEFPFQLSCLYNRTLHNTLQHSISSLPPSSHVSIVLDFFSNPSFDVARSLNIPTYYFWTPCASGLALFFYLPYIEHQFSTCQPFDASKSYIQVPNMLPIRWCDAPPPLTLNSSKKLYDYFLSTSINMSRHCRGVIINTFEGLESRALEVLLSGVCNPEVPNRVPIYCVGPLIGSDESKDNATGNDENECLVWLSSQPRKSVVFLCFGSMGVFSRDQLREIANGLERSGFRFLWVVRDPSKGSDEASLNELLPNGFLERTKKRGFVVKNWAPQKEVLSQDSVGGFVTHCGWNSVLEAICIGVPMIGWPLYAEQRMNRLLLVEEMKVALPLDMSNDGMVESSELERRVRELMESSSVNGEMVRKRVMVMRDAAMAAMNENGSSRIALDKLAMEWSSN